MNKDIIVYFLMLILLLGSMATLSYCMREGMSRSDIGPYITKNAGKAPADPY